MSAHLEPGQLIGDHRIERAIAVGAMGTVFAATDTRLGRTVAIKVLRGHLASSDRFRERFRREASVLARLDSAHVVAIYDHGELDGSPYLITQFAAGGDLGSWVRRHGPLPPAVAVDVAAQVADALVATHAVGVVHRDVKPANVLLRQQPSADRPLEPPHVYLCDFGIARTESSGLTTAGSVTGTWNYLAPELGRGDPATPASDIYAVGCLLHETVTGRPPYTGSDVAVAMAHLDEPVPHLPGTDPLTHGINRVLARTMAKEPTQRYPSAAALRADLRELLEDPHATGSGSYSPLTPLPLAAPPRGRRGRRWLAAGAVAGVVLVAGGVAGWRLFAPGPASDPGGDDDPGTTAPVPAVTGDVDQDGNGDVTLSVGYDKVRIFPSSGSKFGAAENRPDTTASLLGNVDGDRQTDLIDISGDSAQIDADVLTADGWSRVYLRGPDGIDSATGSFAADLNGDGRDDLGMLSAVKKTVHVNGALSEGEDGWSDSAQWLALEPGDQEELRLLPADLDGDGTDELVEVRQSSDSTYLRPWRFADGKLEPLAEGKKMALDWAGGYASLEAVTAGNLDGDGPDEVLMVAGERIAAYHWDDAWAATPLATGVTGADDGYIDDATVSDLDGDGRDEVVLLSESTDTKEIQVWRASDEEHLQRDDTFTTHPGKGESPTLLGSSASGYYY